MMINLFLFRKQIIDYQEMIENLQIVEGRYQNQDHFSFISTFYSNWECEDRTHIVTFVFEKGENKLEAAKQTLEELRVNEDNFVKGQVKVLEHLIDLLV